jgi:hypothetical protein
VLLNTTAPGAATPSFAAQQTFDVGDTPISVAIGDLNGDGKPDLAVANQNSNTVSVLLNATAPGAATPSFATEQTFATGDYPRSVTVGDFNGDGRPDLVLPDQNANTVSVLLNTLAPIATTPGFAVQQSFTAGGVPGSAAMGDLNGDGRPDLAVANAGSNTVSVLLNTTAPGAAMPNFAAQQTFATGANPLSVAMRDLNGDGRPDLAVADGDDDTVSVLLNTTAPGATTPSFTAHETFATGGGPDSVAIGDLNGDGRPDLVVANSISTTLSVLLNTTAPGAATPSFAAQQTFATGSVPVSVAMGDLNGDGRPDLAVANAFSNTVSVLLNTTAPGATTPSFATQQTFAAGANPQSVAVRDLNGDVRPDLVVANRGSNTVSVLLNTTAPGATTPTFAAQQSFAAGAGACAVAVGDLNSDGRPDLAVANVNANTVSVLLNTTAPGATTPSFSAQQIFASDMEPRSAALGDFNGDGRPDLAIANENSGTVSVLLNTLAPFTLGNPATGTIQDDDAPTSIAIAAGNNQSAAVNSAFATNLAVDVRNVNNHLVQGVSVTFVAPGSGPSGTFGGSFPVLSNASGRATAPTFTTNGIAGGPYAVTATASGGTSPSVNFSLTNTSGAPTVTGISVNAGAQQRSRVTTVDVTFSTVVTFSGPVASAFAFTRNGGGALGGFSATANVVGGVTVVTLNNFTGAETEFGSLVDGRFTLTVLANQVSAGGVNMASNATFTDTNGLFRLFGDVNGDRTVNGFDLGFFRNAFGTQTGDSNYLSYFDFNGDGVINGFDLGQFRTRFGTTLP